MSITDGWFVAKRFFALKYICVVHPSSCKLQVCWLNTFVVAHMGSMGSIGVWESFIAPANDASFPHLWRGICLKLHVSCPDMVLFVNATDKWLLLDDERIHGSRQVAVPSWPSSSETHDFIYSQIKQIFGNIPFVRGDWKMRKGQLYLWLPHNTSPTILPFRLHRLKRLEGGLFSISFFLSTFLLFLSSEN